MEEHAWKIISVLLGAIGVFLIWYRDQNEQRHASHEKRDKERQQDIKFIEERVVTQTSLTQMESRVERQMDRLRVDMDSRHKDNGEWQQRIEDKLDRVILEILPHLRKSP